MTTQVIEKMLRDVKARSRPKEQLLQYYIQKRLNRTVSVYYKELMSSCQSLGQHNEVSVLKRLTKELK